MLDKDWKNSTSRALATLNLELNEIARLEPSPGYEQYHAYIVELLKETDLFTTAFAMGMDNMDGASIVAAGEHIENMGILMENAALELEALQSYP